MNKKINNSIFNLILIIVIITSFFLVKDAFALTNTTSVLTNPLGTSDVRLIIGRIINAALGIIGSIALVMFIYGGFTWLTSGGNQERVTKGRKTLVWAVIGIIVVFGSYALVNFILTGITGSGS